MVGYFWSESDSDPFSVVISNMKTLGDVLYMLNVSSCFNILVVTCNSVDPQQIRLCECMGGTSLQHTIRSLGIFDLNSLPRCFNRTMKRIYFR